MLVPHRIANQFPWVYQRSLQFEKNASPEGFRKIITDAHAKESERFKALDRYRELELSTRAADREAAEIRRLLNQLVSGKAHFIEIDFAMAAYRALAEKAPLSQGEVGHGVGFFEKIRRDPSVDYGLEWRAAEILRNLNRRREGLRRPSPSKPDQRVNRGP